MRLSRILGNPDPVQSDAEWFAEENRWNFDTAISRVESFIKMAWVYNLWQEGNNPAHWESVLLCLRRMERDRKRRK